MGKSITENAADKTFVEHLVDTDIVIGDDTISNEFCSKVKMSFFGGEDSITIEPPSIITTAPTFKDEIITQVTPNGKYQWRSDRDDIKWEIVLNSPLLLTNKYTMKLGGDWKDFTYSRQPHFPDPTIITENGVECEFQADMGLLGSNFQQPLKDAGGIVVKHKTKRNYILGQTNYKIGFAFRICRPKVTDSSAIPKSAWCEVGDVDIIKGEYDIAIPPAFLASAVHPITINDTFGNATGSTKGAFNANQARAFGPFTGAAGTATAITFKVDYISANTPMTTAIYADSGGSPSGQSPITNGVSNEATITSAVVDEEFSWTFSTNPTVAATDYHIGIAHGTSSGQANIYFDNTFGAASLWYDIDTYSGGSIADPYTPNAPSPLDATFAYWGYVTYTPGGAPATTGFMTTNKGFW